MKDFEPPQIDVIADGISDDAAAPADATLRLFSAITLTELNRSLH